MTIHLIVADDHPVVLEGIARLIEREPDLQAAGSVRGRRKPP